MKMLFDTEVFGEKEIVKHADVVNEILFNGFVKPVSN